MLAEQSASKVLRSLRCAIRPIHQRISSGPKIPSHSYHSHLCRKKYEWLFSTSLYALVTRGKSAIGNSINAEAYCPLLNGTACCLHISNPANTRPNPAISG